MGNLIIIGIVVASMALLLFKADWITSLRFIPKEDRSDYAAVAEKFIKKNGFIANKIGKVISLSHVGKGGDTERTSFNVFKVKGEEKSAICNMTLNRDENNDWYVTSADILVDGRTLKVPVKRSASAGDKLKTFKMK